jgi:hypothetical protein
VASDVLLAGAVCKQTSFLCSGVHVLSLAIGVLMARVTSSHHVVDLGMTSLASSLDKGLYYLDVGFESHTTWLLYDTLGAHPLNTSLLQCVSPLPSIPLDERERGMRLICTAVVSVT